MQAFAEELMRDGVRVGGVTQTRVAEPSGRSAIMLRDVATGALYPISQDLGPGSVACNLDTSELALACAAIERAARGGAQLIVISKFSKQEAARGGLCDAFRAAMTARIPVIAAVSPHYRDEWRAFAGPLAEDIAPERQALGGLVGEATRAVAESNVYLTGGAYIRPPLFHKAFSLRSMA